MDDNWKLNCLNSKMLISKKMDRSSPVRFCLGMLRLYNDGDKAGRKSVTLNGVLRSIQTVANLLTMGQQQMGMYGTNTLLCFEASLERADDFLEQVDIFLNKEKVTEASVTTTEVTAMTTSTEAAGEAATKVKRSRLVNFNHDKKKTRTTYNHIAIAIGMLTNNCGVVAFQRRQGASGEEDETKRKGDQKIKPLQEKIREQQLLLVEQMKKLNASVEKHEIDESEYFEKSAVLIKQEKDLFALEKSAFAKIDQSTGDHLYFLAKKTAQKIR